MLQRRLLPLTSFSRISSRVAAPLSCRPSHRCRRPYSIHADAASGKQLLDIDVSKLAITKTTSPKTLLPPEELVFGRTFTGTTTTTEFHDPSSLILTRRIDHMLSLEWTALEGWRPGQITPYQNLSLDPATCVFHYAFECFEGMKAYKDSKGQIRLFRPDKNMARLNKSSARIALPTFDSEAMIKLIGELCKLDERFIPS